MIPPPDGSGSRGGVPEGQARSPPPVPGPEQGVRMLWYASPARRYDPVLHGSTTHCSTPRIQRHRFGSRKGRSPGSRSAQSTHPPPMASSSTPDGRHRAPPDPRARRASSTPRPHPWARSTPPSVSLPGGADTTDTAPRGDCISSSNGRRPRFGPQAGTKRAQKRFRGGFRTRLKMALREELEQRSRIPKSAAPP